MRPLRQVLPVASGQWGINTIQKRFGEVNKLYVCPFNLNVDPMSNRETDITLNSMKAAEYFSLFSFSTRRERPLSLGIFPSSGGGSLLTPDPQARLETLNAESWRFADPLRPQSNTNLKVAADANGAVAKKQKKQKKHTPKIQQI